MNSKIIALVACMLIVAGCSSSGELSKRDLCIVKLDDNNTKGKQKICYGMTKEKVEEISGAGQKGLFEAVNYDNGLSVIYRGEKETVVSIRLDEKSKGVYKTIQGLESGGSLSAFQNAFGEQNGILSTDEPRQVNFLYDMKANKYIIDNTDPNVDFENKSKYLFISGAVDSEDNVNWIYLADWQAISTLK